MPSHWRGMALVLIILLVGMTLGVMGGYRLHLQQSFHENAEPVTVRLTVDWPDGTPYDANVTVPGGRAHALGALETGAAGNFTVGTREMSLGTYVHTIGPYRADGSCGWMYGIDGREAHQRPDHAADQSWLEDGAWVAWSWGCL